MHRTHSHAAVLDYWFATRSPRDWWGKSTKIDNDIDRRFGDCLAAAHQDELAHWRDSAAGRLAAIVILNQFPRHIYLATPRRSRPTL